MTITRHASIPEIELVTQRDTKEFTFCSSDVVLMMSDGWTGEIRCKRVVCAVERGTVLCIRPGEVVSTVNVIAPGDIRFLLVASEFWANALAPYNAEGTQLCELSAATYVISEPLREHLDTMFCSLLSRTPHDLSSQIAAVIAHLIEAEIGANVREPKPEPNSGNSNVERFREQLVRKAMGDGTYADGVTSISCPGLTRYQVLRLFKRNFGVTPNAYRLHLQIAQARKSLRHGASPAEVAMLCGFFDQSHLTRHFKRLVGVTPGHYARLSQSESS